MQIKEIEEELFKMKDEKYRDFQSKLIPNIAAETVIGVRTPDLRKLAKEVIKKGDKRQFLDALPHRYFDENQLHAFIISEIKDYGQCVGEVNRFLPYVNNWATCDQMSPKVFKTHKKDLIQRIKTWIDSDETYTIRFGIGALMKYFLEDGFLVEYPEMVAAVRSEEYYVNMMIAWYFATALAKQYDQIIPFIEEKRLEIWTHNKAIQKALESNRITAKQKQYLRSLK